MSGALPAFRYHPDPLATGSVVESGETCVCCVEARGYVYVGPVYGDDDVSGRICPWCIADGSAADEYEAEFTDTGADVADDVDESVLEELGRRTPGFEAWQGDHWLYHCGDAAAYVGQASVSGGDETEYRFRCLSCSAELSFRDEP